MWATRGRRDDFEEDIEMDSAGDRFGAKAQRRSRRRILSVGDFRETVARIEAEAAKVQ